VSAVTLAVAALLGGAAVTSPSALLTDDVPTGFELADAADADLTFEEYAPLSPDATAHVDPASTEAEAMRAAVDVWTAGEDDILLREVTLWPSADAAGSFVERAVVVGVEDGLQQIDAPFEGGVAFVGDDAGLRSRTLTWQQGPYAMTVSHFAANASTDRVVTASAEALAANVEAATGTEVIASPETGRSGGVEDQTETSSEGGIPIATVLLWFVIIGGGIWMLTSVRRRRADTRRLRAESDGEAGEEYRRTGDTDQIAGDGGGTARPVLDRSDHDPRRP